MKRVLILTCLGSLLLVLTACGAGPGGNHSDLSEMPEELRTTAGRAWQWYRLDDEDSCVGPHSWHIRTEEGSQEFEIVQAERVTIQNETAALLSPFGYENTVWCLSFEPALYAGCSMEDEQQYIDDENWGYVPTMRNMIFFHNSTGWDELGGGWTSGLETTAWASFWCSPLQSDCSFNSYAGPSERMFTTVGCSNWQPEGDYSDLAPLPEEEEQASPLPIATETNAPLPSPLPPTEEITRKPVGTSGLVITEVLNPGDISIEAVKIVNEGPMVNLEGWRLVSNGGDEFVFPPFQLFPGGEISVYSGVGENSPTAQYWGLNEAIWRTGDTILLFDPEGNLQGELEVE
jgi:hypothetical protein